MMQGPETISLKNVLTADAPKRVFFCFGQTGPNQATSRTNPNETNSFIAVRFV